MKKLLCALFIMALFLGPVTSAFATSEEMGDTPLAANTYIVVNKSATAAQTTLLPTALFDKTKSKITRVEVYPYADENGHYEAMASLCDASAVTKISDKNVECEVEANTSGDAGIKDFSARPLRILNGCVIQQAPRSLVVVEWEDML